VLGWGRQALSGAGPAGLVAYRTLHAAKEGLKDALAPQSLFSDLGLKYLGPVDGHDIGAVEASLEHAKAYGGSVIVHCITRKGLGYGPAEQDQEDHFHGVGVIDPRRAGRCGPVG